MNVDDQVAIDRHVHAEVAADDHPALPLVHIDLSGWSPSYFPPQLIRHSGTPLREKVLFGSDFPLLTPGRWLDDFAKLDIKPEARPLILKEYAVRLLGLREKDNA